LSEKVLSKFNKVVTLVEKWLIRNWRQKKATYKQALSEFERRLLENLKLEKARSLKVKMF